MTNNKTFFLEIKPAGYYFFGGEQTFNTVEKGKYDEEITNYFAVSNRYPQQTGLLGMLRHTLLKLYDNLNSTAVQKAEIIGGNFNPENDNPFGLIDSISPLVIYNIAQNKILMPAPIDKQACNNFNGFGYSISSKKIYLKEPAEVLPDLSNFDYKKDLYGNWENNGEVFTEEMIFKSVTKVGVNRNKETDGFYKQQMFGLKKDFSFGVWVDFSEQINEEKLIDTLMPFGADHGMVKLKFLRDVPKPSEFEQPQTGNYKSVMLLSDAFVDSDFFDAFDYGITQFIDFRFIKSGTENYYKMDNSGFSKSNKSVLMKRGSVLYFADLSKVQNAIAKLNSSFKRIGYNYFKFI